MLGSNLRRFLLQSSRKHYFNLNQELKSFKESLEQCRLQYRPQESILSLYENYLRLHTYITKTESTFYFRSILQCFNNDKQPFRVNHIRRLFAGSRLQRLLSALPAAKSDAFPLVDRAVNSAAQLSHLPEQILEDILQLSQHYQLDSKDLAQLEENYLKYNRKLNKNSLLALFLEAGAGHQLSKLISNSTVSLDDSIRILTAKLRQEACKIFMNQRLVSLNNKVWTASQKDQLKRRIKSNFKLLKDSEPYSICYFHIKDHLEKNSVKKKLSQLACIFGDFGYESPSQQLSGLDSQVLARVEDLLGSHRYNPRKYYLGPFRPAVEVQQLRLLIQFQQQFTLSRDGNTRPVSSSLHRYFNYIQGHHSVLSISQKSFDNMSLVEEGLNHVIKGCPLAVV